MCGLVGVAGKLEFRDEHLLKHLLYLDMWRGKDSTGVAAVRNDGEIRVAKIASHPIDLFDTMRFRNALGNTNVSVYLGHNRAATKGAVNEVNAHPFVSGHIVGAHNGTLSPSSHRELDEASGEKHEVDSQSIFAAIATIGLKETAKLLQGAWALSYYDSNEGTLNFLRNDQRPLWFAWSEDRNRLIWASEFDFISYASKSGNSPTKLFADPDGYKFFPFENDKHYCFDVEALRGATVAKPYKPKAKELKGKEPAKSNSDVFPTHRNTGVANISTPPSTSNTNSQGTVGTASTTISRFKERRASGVDKQDERLVHMEGSAGNPYAGIISRDRFEEITSDGCAFCNRHIEWGDTGVTIIEKIEAAICPCCNNHNKKVNRILVPDVKAFL
jgi:predicted glutamine amidotransferase